MASWYTPGPVDGLGDRLLMFDNTGADSLELLRFYPSLSDVAGFEDALRERVRQVGQIPDDAFPLVVAVERLEGEGALALVSTHVPGKRLSVFFDRPGRRGLNPSFVAGMATQVARALAVLQSQGPDVAHGALTPDRVVVSSGGRVYVVEHVLGSALRRLNVSAARLWREFGLATPPGSTGPFRLDARTDVFQLGVIALEMLLGRRLSRLDLTERLPDLLREWSAGAARANLSSDRLRAWLERALQIGSGAYHTAADAYADLRDMPSEPAAAAFELLTGDTNPAPERPQPPATSTAGREVAAGSLSTPVRPREAAPPAPAPLPHRIRTAEPEREPAPAAPPIPAPAANGPAARRSVSPGRRLLPWIAAAAGLVALVEGGVIATLMVLRPADAPVADPAAGPRAPTGVGSGPVVETLAAVSPEPPETSGPLPPAIAAEVPLATANPQRAGGVRLQAPIELNVLHGDEVLGSTADGPIIMRAGTYQLDLINAAVGLRMRQEVTFRAGQIARVDVALPTGLVSVNAQPWAVVSIDDLVFGETPLANLPVPLGRHEIVFRHPELGERRQTITVRADGPTRVSTTFEPSLRP